MSWVLFRVIINSVIWTICNAVNTLFCWTQCVSLCRMGANQSAAFLKYCAIIGSCDFHLSLPPQSSLEKLNTLFTLYLIVLLVGNIKQNYTLLNNYTLKLLGQHIPPINQSIVLSNSSSHSSNTTIQLILSIKESHLHSITSILNMRVSSLPAVPLSDLKGRRNQTVHTLYFKQN